MASCSTEAPPSSPSDIPTINNSTKTKSRCSILSLVSNFRGKYRVSKPKMNIIHSGNSATSSSATTNKNDQQGEALPPSSEKIPDDLHLVDSALKNYIDHMNVQINLAREKFKELQNLGSSEKDFDELQKAIAKLKLQIPTTVNIISTTNKDNYHRGDLSPSSQKICSDLLFLDSAFAKAKEYMDHTSVKINQAHDKFKELQILPSRERDSDEVRESESDTLLMAVSDEKRKADSDKLRKGILKLKVHIPSHPRIHPADLDPRHRKWPNINEAKDGMTHFFYGEREVPHNMWYHNRVKKAFDDLSVDLRCCLLSFFKFPPMATIKRSTMIYLWIGQSFYPKPLLQEESEEDAANKVFDELIEKSFIEPVFQNCSLVPDSCRMSLFVRSSLYETAVSCRFTSNDTLDLDFGSAHRKSDVNGKSFLINVGEAIIDSVPEIFANMKSIQSLHLGRWQSSESSAEHHIELADAKILHGLKKLYSLTFLSLRGISMITELPLVILELNDLKILDLRACHNLEVIPDKIGLLNKLTHLDVSECYLLEHMPKSLAQLSNLEVLKGFLLGDFKNNKQLCTLNDLSRLQYLRKLNIYISVKSLLRLQDFEDLEKFVGMQKLTISCGGCSLQAQTEVITKAFHYATLPPRLQKLDLQGFPTTSLPNCLMPGKLTELKKLYIRGGQLCDLGQIQKHQGEQWTVEILRLKYLSKLEIDWGELRILFPKLVYLHQVECPKFTNFRCDERGVWMNNNAIDTHVMLQKYLKTSGIISLSSI
ncbi:hypothetical protein Vadar_003047 [Vaccinium darrowii]|uniref:Uncharacterized protein n=1 Tax=Vaccinium darrowii TaxID=229202 RepID=A0ACB7Z1C6_9ERIC|nr:hypothetical protein Vadar_003047 [Vaccinium darrowii]